MAGISRKNIMREVKRAITSKRAKGVRYMTPTKKEMERIINLRAYGPLEVMAVDVGLAYKGWAYVYDDDPGNESVDFTHPCSMEAGDIFERAFDKYYGRRR